tara:strand:- start:681 stop:1082 length:402 start_codon:yes stop_codon:yes gene_type:complete
MKDQDSNVITSGKGITIDGTFFSREELAEAKAQQEARKALGNIHLAVPAIVSLCMTLKTWVYGEKNAFGKVNKKKGEAGSMYYVDAQKFCVLFNKCLPAGVKYHFVPRGSKNDIITLQHIDGKTPLIDGQVYN